MTNFEWDIPTIIPDDEGNLVVIIMLTLLQVPSNLLPHKTLKLLYNSNEDPALQAETKIAQFLKHPT